MAELLRILGRVEPLTILPFLAGDASIPRREQITSMLLPSVWLPRLSTALIFMDPNPGIPVLARRKLLTCIGVGRVQSARSVRTIASIQEIFSFRKVRDKACTS